MWSQENHVDTVSKQLVLLFVYTKNRQIIHMNLCMHIDINRVSDHPINVSHSCILKH